MNEIDSDSSEIATGEEARNSVEHWIPITLLGALVVGGLFGFATPRIKLLLLFPLGLGILTGVLAVAVANYFQLNVSKGMIVWMILFGALTFEGATRMAVYQWSQKATRFLQFQFPVTDDDLDAESRRTLQEFKDRSRKSRTYQEFLSHRLTAFAKQVGREQVWSSPVPEMIYGSELFLAAIGAGFVGLKTRRSQLASPVGDIS